MTTIYLFAAVLFAFTAVIVRSPVPCLWADRLETFFAAASTFSFAAFVVSLWLLV